MLGFREQNPDPALTSHAGSCSTPVFVCASPWDTVDVFFKGEAHLIPLHISAPTIDAYCSTDMFVKKEDRN